MDFTVKQYIELIEAIRSQEFFFQTFAEFLQSPKQRSVILRHDVDLLPLNSLKFAQIQAGSGAKGTYYFRAVPESWNEQVIKEIAGLGHEIGYHYETMDTANGNIEKAWDQFRYHLDELRKITEVFTICMHGSPRSKFDNKEIWKSYDYKSLGLIGEPYYDVDFNKVFYLTDTGRMWDGHKVSIRDKVSTSFDKTYHSTSQLIEALESHEFPDQIMFTFHPQRWHDNKFLWTKELVLQNAKNIVKKYVIEQNKA